ncbi:hypothetical protein WICPIJ_003904 [Wickerhamomyces pijperi]|uniref:Uncharacterized protein n=1 Tax=Wickerhamomyces pijperi TaxID=599730 RepID=A0A9P8Q8S9_WICPI|nr:hypothetical protein WICPIJ_003904 [Wickerhamomyces pijperi]
MTTFNHYQENNLRLPMELIANVLLFLPYQERISFCSKHGIFYKFFPIVPISYIVFHEKSSVIPEEYSKRFESSDVVYFSVTGTGSLVNPDVIDRLTHECKRLVKVQLENTNHKVVITLAHDLHSCSCYHAANLYAEYHSLFKGIKHEVEIVKDEIPVTSLTKSKDMMIGLFDYVHQVEFGYDEKLGYMDINSQEFLLEAAANKEVSDPSSRSSYLRSCMFFEDDDSEAHKKSILSLDNPDLNSLAVFCISGLTNIASSKQDQVPYLKKTVANQWIATALDYQNLTRLCKIDELQIIKEKLDTIRRYEMSYIELPYITDLLKFNGDEVGSSACGPVTNYICGNCKEFFNCTSSYSTDTTSIRRGVLLDIILRGYYGIEKYMVTNWKLGPQMGNIKNQRTHKRFQETFRSGEFCGRAYQAGPCSRQTFDLLNKYYISKGSNTNCVKVTLLHSFEDIPSSQLKNMSMEATNIITAWCSQMVNTVSGSENNKASSSLR